jgi:hypothetical protein
MKTTMNVHVEILNQIARAAKLRCISSSEMIVILLNMVMGDINNPGHLGRLVRYQKRRDPKDWHVFHIKIREDVYEYCLDLRKLLKMPVSLILARAVKKYLRKLDKIHTDNYRFTNYIIIKEVIDSAIVWKFIWGWPPSFEGLIN